MDSACSTTTVNSQEGITNYDPSNIQQITLADKSEFSSKGTGIISGNGKNLKVHIVPSLGENLLSFPQLFNQNIATVFHSTFGVMIADACHMQFQCSAPLGT
jgi:hypothetical protein